MSDTEGEELATEAEDCNVVPFMKRRPSPNERAALLARMDAALERSRASLAEYKAILTIIKRDYTARDGGDAGTVPGDRIEDEGQ